MCSCYEYDSVDELEAACQADATCQAYSTGALSGDALCLTSDHVPKSQSEFKECHVKTIGGYGMCSFSVSVLLCTHTCTVTCYALYNINIGIAFHRCVAD